MRFRKLPLIEVAKAYAQHDQFRPWSWMAWLTNLLSVADMRYAGLTAKIGDFIGGHL